MPPPIRSATQGIGTPRYLGAYRGDALVGLLGVFERQSEAGIAYCSLPYFGPNAGVVCATGPEQEAIHAALLGSLLEAARADDALSCAVYTPLLFRDFALAESREPEEDMLDVE